MRVASRSPCLKSNAMRRYRTIFADFDTRALNLADPVPDSWEEEVRALHLENRARTHESLRAEFGSWDAERKLADFIAIGVKPFSVVSYHNTFFAQTRDAFVLGAYYPALLGACALGERILNHLVLDLRDDFIHTAAYAEVATDRSFSNWKLMIRTLDAWGVLEPGVSELFRQLSRLRHRSIHFNPATYTAVRKDALAAIVHLRDILEKQFGAVGRHRWYIRGTLGACFIAKAWEQDPFVRRFIVPSATYVGPLHSVRPTDDMRWQFVDWTPDVYGKGEISDEDYCRVFNEATPESRVPTDGPFTPATIRSPEDAQRYIDGQLGAAAENAE